LARASSGVPEAVILQDQIFRHQVLGALDLFVGGRPAQNRLDLRTTSSETPEALAICGCCARYWVSSSRVVSIALSWS
jgi:hypothetical protein